MMVIMKENEAIMTEVRYIDNLVLAKEKLYKIFSRLRQGPENIDLIA